MRSMAKISRDGPSQGMKEYSIKIKLCVHIKAARVGYNIKKNKNRLKFVKRCHNYVIFGKQQRKKQNLCYEAFIYYYYTFSYYNNIKCSVVYIACFIFIDILILTTVFCASN